MSGHASVFVTKHAAITRDWPGSVVFSLFFSVGTIDTMTPRPDCSFEKVSDFSQSKINKQMTEFAFEMSFVSTKPNYGGILKSINFLVSS